MAETTLTRRSFVKASALTAAATAIGASMAGCMQETSKDEAAVSADSTSDLVKMKTSYHGCIQMCPAIAYLKDGVVVRLEGDPEAPVSRGSLCIKGLNQLYVSWNTVRTHTRNVYTKLDVHSKQDVIALVDQATNRLR